MQVNSLRPEFSSQIATKTETTNKVGHSSSEKIDTDKAVSDVKNQKQLHRMASKRPEPRKVDGQPSERFAQDQGICVKKHIQTKGNIPSGQENLKGTAKMQMPSDSRNFVVISKGESIVETEEIKVAEENKFTSDNMFDDLEVEDEDFDDEIDSFNEDCALYSEDIDSEKSKKFEVNVSDDHLESIKSYFSSKPDLEHLNEPTMFRHKDTGLPYSVLVMPGKGPESGLYIMLKSKEGHQKVGHGAVCVVTHMIHIDSAGNATNKVNRSAAKAEMSDSEIEINREIYQSGSKNLIGGLPFEYRGKWSPREGQVGEGRLTMYGERRVELLNTEKIGFALDLVKGNSLDVLLGEKIRDPSVSLDWARKSASVLAELHDLRIVHGDIKPENFILSDDGDIKLCDFGGSAKFGEDAVYGGSKGYTAPGRLLKETEPNSDIWSYGMMLSEMFYGPSFIEICSTSRALIDPSELELLKLVSFPDLYTPGHIDNIIDRCLSLNSDDRPSAHEIVALLNEIS